MTDQRVSISNIPQSSSKERVAYDLYLQVSNAEYQDGKKRTRKEILDLYAECLLATSGYRDVPR